MASPSSQSPSPSPSSSAFSSQSWNHDVFLSFRGEDTRKTFVDHLNTALVQQGIHTYKDDETLPRGELIGPSLKKAIKESQVAIIVLSKNYADSSWCLDELAHIMKCKDTRGQIVLPVFYDVDPSEVRKQKRKYGEAFMKHELENKNKVESWRKALVDASNISGWEIKHIANGHESKGIKEIVDTISQRLQLVTSSANENLIGIAARVQGLKSKLQIGSGGVHMIGIWGVGGGGKTTLASSIYDEISSKFDGCCFVENIREESSRHGFEKLQEKILSELKVNRVGGGRCLMNNRFRHRKVLIVLDDVDHLDQLKALAGSHNWFGEGSRIIITTRDEHLLNAHKVDVVHNISLLNDDEAIKLFCKHAPQGHRPMEDYQLLSKDVVSCAGGLPLALTVLGCFLCDKDIHEWRSALARLKDIPDCDIVEKLKISFDGLKSVEKKLFLDIACFHRGRYRSEGMVEMFDACGFHPGIGIKVLIQKALITIVDGKFDMHDLVEEMAHYIVRGEHPKNPEKHSRVWEVEDVLKLYDMDATTELDAIEAIKIDYIRDPPSQEVDTVEAAKFDYNSNHRFQHVSQIVANMKNLRWINWTGGPTSPLPTTNFPQRKLCCLLLWGAMQKQLWEGYKHLPNLKIIELYGLDNLIMTPDFDGLPNLERFKLTTSPYLEEIHPSIGRLERLNFISIENCSSLKRFPPITRLKKLETLTLSRNPKLFKLLEIQENHIGLRISHSGLRNLNLSSSNLEDKDMSSAVWELPNLQKLDLGGNDFSRLKFSLLRLPQLKWLDVSWCDGLVELSELPSSISVVIADNCTSLETFGDISNCKWLWNVSLRRENKLGPFIGDRLQQSMLEIRASPMGVAIEDHFFNVTLQHQIPKEFVGRLFRGKTSTLHLPHNWYNDFSGILTCIVTDMRYPNVNIIIKHEVDEEDHRSNEAVEPEYDGTTACVGYVPFASLRHDALLSSSYNIISFSVDDMFWSSKSYIGAELVPRKIKGDEVQTTKASTSCSGFYDQEREDGKNTFTIQDDSHSIKILWKPYYNSI